MGETFLIQKLSTHLGVNLLKQYASKRARLAKVLYWRGRSELAFYPLLIYIEEMITNTHLLLDGLLLFVTDLAIWAWAPSEIKQLKLEESLWLDVSSTLSLESVVVGRNESVWESNFRKKTTPSRRGGQLLLPSHDAARAAVIIA